MKKYCTLLHVDIIDDNAFTSLTFMLKNQNLSNEEVDMLHAYALPKCSRCKRRSATFEFICNIRGMVYELCYRCGKHTSTPADSLTCLYSKIGTESGGGVVNRSELHRITVSPSKSLGIGFYCMHSASLAEVGSDYLSYIPNFFETIDRYQYIANRTRSG